MPDKTSVRLNKYISESGICSRREADRYIEQGNVLINGRRAKIGDQVFSSDRVVVNGNVIEPRDSEDTVFLAFNKPVGITSTTEASVKDNIIDYVNYSRRIFPIGRLDKDSQGLIFLTNNGDIVNKILRASNNHEKEYLVTVNKPVTDQFVAAMSSGVPILGVMTKKCQVKKEAAFVFRITLIQGMNRQIRRMCEHFDYEVTKLERVRIMNVSLKGLALGEWRELTDEELGGIYKLIAHSENTPSRPKENRVKEKSRDERPSKTNKESNRPFRPSKPKDKQRGRSAHGKDTGGRSKGNSGKGRSSGGKRKRY